MAETAKKNALVSDELASKFKTEKETPYTRWVKAEGLDIIPSFYVRNLRTAALKPWARRSGNAVFLNHDASRTSNDCYVMEIPPGKSLAPHRQLYEEMVLVCGRHDRRDDERGERQQIAKAIRCPERTPGGADYVGVPRDDAGHECQRHEPDLHKRQHSLLAADGPDLGAPPSSRRGETGRELHSDRRCTGLPVRWGGYNRRKIRSVWQRGRSTKVKRLRSVR